MRAVLVIYHSVALALSPSFGRSISLVLHLRLHSPVSLISNIIYLCYFVLYPFIWRNPFSSLGELGLLFFYFALLSCIVIVSLYNVLITIFLQQVCIHFHHNILLMNYKL